ncbi:Tail-anchored protein insertion receptor WRB [Blattella germanica]|nr:Tail-anchored protein insertion receptor WRB [Blattella germanica]
MYLFLLATCISFLGAFIPIITKFVFSFLYMETKQERAIQNEILNIRREMSNISMIDEFARYAKLQRMLNKLQEQWKCLANARHASNLKYKLLCTYLLQGIITVTLLFIIWSNRYIPVIVLPKGWLYPLSGLFAWPTGTEGGVSISVWLLICGTTARMISSAIKV